MVQKAWSKADFETLKPGMTLVEVEDTSGNTRRNAGPTRGADEPPGIIRDS